MKTPKERAARVIAANGRAPNLIKQLSKDEVAELATFIDAKGTLLPGTVKEGEAEVEVSPQERFRLFLVEHFEGKKATVAEVERPVVAEATTEE